jgi:hypothetical protein
MDNENLCVTCESSIMCNVWGQYKCKVKQRYITGPKKTCMSYKKRSKNFEEPKCHCDDCTRYNETEET